MSEVPDVKLVPDPTKHESSMVYLAFADGEISLTKCGPLWMQRTLHMIARGLTKEKTLPEELRSGKMGGFDYALVDTNEEAEAIRCYVTEDDNA